MRISDPLLIYGITVVSGYVVGEPTYLYQEFMTLAVKHQGTIKKILDLLQICNEQHKPNLDNINIPEMSF